MNFKRLCRCSVKQNIRVHILFGSIMTECMSYFLETFLMCCFSCCAAVVSHNTSTQMVMTSSVQEKHNWQFSSIDQSSDHWLFSGIAGDLIKG